MRLIPMIIASLYDHFYKMRERGRKVVPWLQTVFACTLEATFLTVFMGKIIVQRSPRGTFGHVGNEVLFFLFLCIGVFYFFIIKSVYFDSQKFTGYYEAFLQLPAGKRKVYKALVIGVFIIIPFLLVYKIWYDAG